MSRRYKPKFRITPHLIQRIEAISALRDRILGSTIQVSWLPALQKDAKTRNTHGSTAIEGNPLSLDEVRQLAEGKDLPSVHSRSKQEILNYFAGLRFVEQHSRKRIITPEDLLKLHFIMANKVMDQGIPGVYRSIKVYVGSHVPPPPEDVPHLMREFLEWWNKDSVEWTPVISSAIVHYRFEEIHPFADGNGRVGRALALWELYRRGFDTHHIFSIDEIYWENRLHYYRALQRVQDSKGDLTSWLEFVAKAVHLTLERVWMRAELLSQQVTQQKIVLSLKQERLLSLLRERGVMAPREIWKALGISKQGALNLVNPLVKVGLVVREGTRKSGKYRLH